MPESHPVFRWTFGRLVTLRKSLALVEVREGDSVAFRAERRGGENVLTAIRMGPPRQRFEKCE